MGCVNASGKALGRLGYKQHSVLFAQRDPPLEPHPATTKAAPWTAFYRFVGINKQQFVISTKAPKVRSGEII